MTMDADRLRQQTREWREIATREMRENRRLRAALEPFAEVARWAERNGHDLTKGWDMLIRGNGAICHLGVQSPEFIDALRALNGQPLGAREQSERKDGK